ncbi:ATP phosphoribosyltransferase regulatory subunit [Alkalibacillus aidingensis]|uniref:ATP phosphoribosyltransferase regulatory subunit n=1 Tax=Alkalibacillus aidingensis TaxID=2747607 RepID=UPI001660D9DE|nr:ATP phosphoribosyltransferase regulatory subunit [Alkalibacillus aidingensis]
MSGQQLPRGVSDLYTDDYHLKESLINNYKRLLNTYGYNPIQTPTFEFYDLFMNVPGTMDADQMIKLIDPDGKVLVLRPDATVPIARMVSQSQLDVKKFCYVTNIFRMESSESDRTSRSFSQVGVEWFDHAHPLHDVEMISLAIEMLKQSGIERIQLEIGQASFFKSLLKSAQLPPSEEQEIQKKVEAKNGYELKAYLNTLEIDEDIYQVLLAIPNLFGSPKTVLTEAKRLVLNDEMRQAVEKLDSLVKQLHRLGYEQYVSLDLGLINHLNYYTGVMFQAYVEGYGKPIIQGGRYDELTKYFDLKTSAIGFGLYVDDLMTILKQQNRADIEANQSITISTSEKELKEAMDLAMSLRAKGVVVNMVYAPLNAEISGDLIDFTSKSYRLNCGTNQGSFNSVIDLQKKVGLEDYATN